MLECIFLFLALKEKNVKQLCDIFFVALKIEYLDN